MCFNPLMELAIRILPTRNHVTIIHLRKEKKTTHVMKLVCFSTSNHVGLENLKQSVNKNPGWDFTIIGTGTAWKGWQTRMKAYKDHCQSLPPNELVVLCDAYDVLCLKSPDGFQEKFIGFQKSIVIGAESGCDDNCHPPEHWWSVHNISPNTVLRFCNGGLMTGYAHALATMWEWALEKNFQDDQIACGNYMDTYPDRIHLDSQNTLFFNDVLASQKYQLAGIDNKLISNNRILDCYFIHFPGINIYTSVPFFKLFKPKELFEVGPNYKTIGEHVIGKNTLINDFTPDKRGSQTGLLIERIIFYGIAGCLGLVFIVLLILCLRK